MAREHCSVTSELNRYLATLDSSEAREAEINEEVGRLMEPGQEYCPWTTANFAEALGEITAAAGNDVENMAIHGHNKAASLAGVLLLNAVADYWKALARNEAENNVIRAGQQPEPEDRRDYELDH